MDALRYGIVNTIYNIPEDDLVPKQTAYPIPVLDNMGYPTGEYYTRNTQSDQILEEIKREAFRKALSKIKH